MLSSTRYGCSLPVAGLVLLLGLVVGGSPVRAEPEVTPGPRVEILDREIDLGPLVRGASAEAVFRLRNAGDRPLRLLKVKPG